MDKTSCDYKFDLSDALYISAYSIIFYDYFLTLPMEVDRYWCPGSHTWASTLFLVIRYVALLGHLPLLYSIFGDPCVVQRKELLIASYHNILIYFLAFVTCVLLIMRVYALYFRNRWILFIVTLEFTAVSILACWTIKLMAGLDTGNSKRRNYLSAVAFSCLLVFDITVFVLTMARSIKLWAHNEPFLRRLFIDGAFMSYGLFVELTCRDHLGILYYGVICNINLINVIVLLVENPNLNLPTPIFTYVLSVVMITRLMINLRDPTIHNGTDTTLHVGYVSTLVDDTYYSSMI